MKTSNLNAPNDDKKNNISKTKKFAQFLGGDILLEKTIQKNIPIIFLSIILIIVYVSNRYQYQQDLIEKNRLEIILKDIKYRALTRTADLMDKSRQSKIEEHITRKGSELEIPTNPPYIIK
ncbi:FtsL-like putative cell division protein [Bacteroides propionicifaciens]|jgi:hypothetical protein|uniref:FtsL-like putative cell division protein n=1 Tax=Bacteroides propionicifaciens TaxID=392838 RepID=UPI00035CC949|nr:FtsL-like putative cell division protein [Bacteroides propionicifaciens]